jgi:hypothetical protein
VDPPVRADRRARHRVATAQEFVDFRIGHFDLGALIYPGRTG